MLRTTAPWPLTMWHTAVVVLLVACLASAQAGEHGAHRTKLIVEQAAAGAKIESKSDGMRNGEQEQGGGQTSSVQAHGVGCGSAAVHTGFGLTACSRFYTEFTEDTWENCCSKCNEDK
jgi:hypothetical protein